MPNRLAHETSPYLLQHRDNPVDWYPWGPEALERARASDRPILLSIGYSACHWCHVMERESFEDPVTAELMNELFVCIKVDREERPDLDEIYMRATLAMNHGHGGWPMTVFLTPSQEPFYAGTYFPPTDRYGRPGFRTVLRSLGGAWRDQRGQVVEQARRLTDHLTAESLASAPLPVGEQELRLAAAQYRRDFDPRWGGFGNAPKFPPATGLQLLLRAWRRFGDGECLRMVEVTLAKMADGGMYDQIAGGFCRYSTDERWLVPHFEKMLYDNALLARAYLEGWQATGVDRFRVVAVEILEYVLREMTGPEGGFFSATDADSEGVEGKFFVWDPAEVEQILGAEEARRVCAWLDITDGGNWEGRSIPNTPRPAGEVASELGISTDELAASVAAGREKLRVARERRVHPGLDDKILTAWNAMMISAFAEAHRALREPRYLAAAVRCADFLRSTLRRPDGGLYRTFRAGGKAHLDGYLEDYAWLTEALIDLYEASGERLHLDRALEVAERMRADFSDDETGAFYTTARGHERLIVRHREAQDGATPSGNNVAASALARLGFHLGRDDLREAGARAAFAFGGAVARFPRAFAKALLVGDLLAGGPVELALVGAAGAEDTEALAGAVGQQYLGARIVAAHDPARGPSTLPLLDGKTAVGGRAALYVCRGYACQAPITDPAAVVAALAPGRTAEARPPSPRAATVEATRARTAKLGPHGVSLLGETGLTVSKLGFGGYRVHESAEHAEALSAALAAGVNLIDTSTNYTDGSSERLIGEVLARADGGGVSREGIVVVSKIGYVQGNNLRDARQRESRGAPFPEMVKYTDSCWHCLHPEFLADQLPRSLARLQLPSLDVCLLHNPEYFLSDAAKREADGEAQPPLERRREIFYARLRAAFRFFERAVRDGTLAHYGVSSNTVAAADDDPEATSLARILEAAEAAALDEGSARCHFAVLQLPMNLLEADGVARGVLAQAQARGIGVLVNRPLNAIRGRGMVRFADPGAGSEGIDDERQRRTAAWAAEQLDPALPPERRSESLSRRALWVLASTPGVSSVLLGMRRPPLVADALAVLGWPPLDGAAEIYARFSG